MTEDEHRLLPRFDSHASLRLLQTGSSWSQSGPLNTRAAPHAEREGGGERGRQSVRERERYKKRKGGRESERDKERKGGGRERVRERQREKGRERDKEREWISFV